MSKIKTVLISLVVLLGIGCAPHWDYKNTDWASLSEKWAACDGKSQSPIDITSEEAAPAKLDSNSLTFHYAAANGTAKIKNNGHTIQVDFPAGSTVTIAGTTYELLQFHFHNQSEHTVNKAHHGMEMHLVHKDAGGNLAVVGVFLSSTGAGTKDISAFLNTIGWGSLESLSKEPKAIEGTVDIYSALPALDENSQSPYYSYSGSLTTPPCSEGVNWNVLSTPVNISKEQAAEFFKATGNYKTNRPVQALNGRTVKINK